MLGGAGNDLIRGGEGDDLLRGRQGNDVEEGGEGNDVVWVGRGTDREFGGPGDDTMHALANDNRVDFIDCGDGNDTLYENAREHDRWVNCENVIRETPSAAEAADDDG